MIVQDTKQDPNKLDISNYLRTPETTTTIDDMMRVAGIRISLLKDAETKYHYHVENSSTKMSMTPTQTTTKSTTKSN